MPKISIGMPVYNAKRTLPSVLSSLEAQTFSDYEVIIVDNCSSDGTESILLDYAKRDQRIKLTLRDENVGPLQNFADTFSQSCGDYFTWWAADDWRSPDWLEACILQFRESSSAVAVMPPYCFDFDKTNQANWHLYTLEGATRLATLCDNYHLSNSVFYALIRREIVADWFDKHSFLAINGFDWLFILYIVCRGDVVRTRSALMVAGTDGDSRRGWLFQRSFLEIHVPLFAAYHHIDTMLQAAEGVSQAEKYLASARLLARPHEVGDQISRFWSTLSSPIVPLEGFTAQEKYSDTSTVQWCRVCPSEAASHRELSLMLQASHQVVDTYIINPGQEAGSVILVNQATQATVKISLSPGVHLLDVEKLCSELLIGSYSLISILHDFIPSQVKPVFGSDILYFGIVRGFRVTKPHIVQHSSLLPADIGLRSLIKLNLSFAARILARVFRSVGL